MKNRPEVYWVLVADGGQARILEFNRKPYKFRQVSELVSDAQHLTSHQLVSDANGRSFHVQGPGSHVKQPRSNPHDQAEREFTRALARTLGKALQLHAFDYLVVVADPRTLGRLRRDLSPAVAGKVSDEFGIDLAGMPLNQLEPRIRSVLGWKAA